MAAERDRGADGRARARAGRSVVRLKGGDPFVFGRGGEEAEALAAAAVPFEVVPGVTAGVAAPAYAGIPVTHREDASAVAFVTGHEDPAKDDTALDWEALARFPGTLVLYMGVGRAGEIAEQPDRRRARPGRARGGGRAGDAARPADRDRDPRRPRRRDRRGRVARARDRPDRAGGRAPRADRLARAAPPPRAAGGRHPRARPGQRPRATPGGPGRRGGRAARDPDRAPDRLRGGARGRRRPSHLRARLPDEPQRVRLLFEAMAAQGATRVRSPTPRWPRSAPEPPPRSASAA